MTYKHNSNLNPEAFQKWTERTSKKIKILVYNDYDLGRYLLGLLQNKNKPLTREQRRYITETLAREYPSFKARWQQLCALTEEITEWKKEMENKA